MATRSDKTIKEKLNIVRIGIAAIIVVIVVFAALVLLNGGKPPVIPLINGNGEIPYEHYNETENETGPQNGNGEICDDECLYGRAVAEKDVKYCDWMINSSSKQGCYEAIADESLDACLKVEDELAQYGCIVVHANVTDITTCDYLIVDQDALRCRQQFDPCYYYDGTERRACLALEHEDVSYCEKDDICLFNYSIETGDGSICEDIGLVAEKQACRSYFAGTDMCDELPATAEKNYCWQLYAVLSDNKLICTQIETVDGPYALDCFSYFAARTHDLGFCRAGPLILDDLWKCYINYSLITGDLAGCDSIHHLASTNRFTCYYEYAKKYGNPHACDLMNDPRYAKTCYVGSIMNNTNLNFIYCPEIAEEIWKNKCYTESAKLNKDISICDYIPATLERQICTDSYHTFVNGQSD